MADVPGESPLSGPPWGFGSGVAEGFRRLGKLSDAEAVELAAHFRDLQGETGEWRRSGRQVKRTWWRHKRVDHG